VDHRRKLLAQAPTYFSNAERFLRGCPHLDVGSHVPTPLFNEDFGRWEGEVFFSTTHVLGFRDIYFQHSNGRLERTVNFDFRLRHAKDVTFRVDAHGPPVIDGAQLHLDLPGEITYTDGDPKLKGYELTHFTMIDMVYLIGLHLEGVCLPWQ
jgi:hypothetical protein